METAEDFWRISFLQAAEPTQKNREMDLNVTQLDKSTVFCVQLIEHQGTTQYYGQPFQSHSLPSFLPTQVLCKISIQLQIW